jgi:hypothetical protein
VTVSDTEAGRESRPKSPETGSPSQIRAIGRDGFVCVSGTETRLSSVRPEGLTPAIYAGAGVVAPGSLAALGIKRTRRLKTEEAMEPLLEAEAA